MYLFRCNFSSCSESPEIWHADSFCVKKCPCFFSHEQGNNASNTFLKVHHPSFQLVAGNQDFISIGNVIQ